MQEICFLRRGPQGAPRLLCALCCRGHTRRPRSRGCSVSACWPSKLRRPDPKASAFFLLLLLFLPPHRASGRAPWRANASDSKLHREQGWKPRVQAPDSEQRTSLPHETREKEQEALVKRRFAVLVGYAGTGYSGSQVNPGVDTVEGDVFSALVGAGAVTEANATNPSKVDLRRAARTDTGVHAVTNVFSLKLEVPECVARAPSVEENYHLSRAMRFRHLRHQFGRARKTSAGVDPVPVSQDELDRAQSRARDAMDLLRARANQFLPPSVRIFSIVRVGRQFDPRMYASSRRYEYFLPTYLFLPPRPDTWMHRRYLRFREQEMAGSSTYDPKWYEGLDLSPDWREHLEQDPPLPSWDDLLDHPFWRSLPPHPHAGRDPPIYAPDVSQHTREATPPARAPPSAEEQAWLVQLYAQLPTFRLSSTTLARARLHARCLIGQHNFHNFTIRKPAGDPEAWRILREMHISDPFLQEDNVEWVKISVHGDSFMLHQIRKMVGMLLAVTRSRAPPRIWYEAMQPDRFLVPMAPSEGLLLRTPLFEGYHKDLAERLPLLQFPLYPRIEPADPQEVTAFANQHIYPLIHQRERDEHLFYRWMETVDNYHPILYDWLTPQGHLPAAARLPPLPTLPAGHARTRTRSPAPRTPTRAHTAKPSHP